MASALACHAHDRVTLWGKKDTADIIKVVNPLGLRGEAMPCYSGGPRGPMSPEKQRQKQTRRKRRPEAAA